MSTTKITWCSHTANWLAGCTKVSPACANCYAETMSARIVHMGGPARYQGVTEGRRWTGRIRYDEDALADAFDELTRAKKPRRVFINSMSDTFHEDAPPESLDDLGVDINALEFWRREDGATTALCGHVIMLLTKRPERMLEWQRQNFPGGLPSWVWVGVTVEDQDAADERIPVLLEVRAAVRFLSCEPLLGPVEIESPYIDPYQCIECGASGSGDSQAFEFCAEETIVLNDRISWLIAGCESGPRRRPSKDDWFRDLRDQCKAAGVPYFLKQTERGGRVIAHPELDGRRWEETP